MSCINRLDNYGSKRQKIEETKKPRILDGHLFINGVEYAIKEKGQGQNHKVWEFIDTTSITIGEKTIDLSKVIMRIPSPVKNPQKQIQIHEDDKYSYELYKKLKITLPEAFLKPDEFKDIVNKNNGGFWLLEKCVKPISTKGWEDKELTLEKLSKEDKSALVFAKTALTKMAQEENDVPNDFLPRNVMINNDGSFCLVDFSRPQEDDWLMNLKSYLKGWSQGNEHIYSYLTDEMPTNVINLLTTLQEKS